LVAGETVEHVAGATTDVEYTYRAVGLGQDGAHESMDVVTTKKQIQIRHTPRRAAVAGAPRFAGVAEMSAHRCGLVARTPHR
jgi:hypothetical protein